MKGLNSLLFVLFLFLCPLSCGSNPKIQSISITPAAATAQGGEEQFTASGRLSSMMTVDPLSVSWFQSFPIFDPPGGAELPFQLTAQPFIAKCLTPGPMAVVAFAPVDPHASAGGNIPIQVFLDLAVRRTATEEGGFIASTAQLTCP